MTSKTHRFSSCHRHPSKPITGFCAYCLTERLAGIESSTTVTADDSSHPAPELRRSKSCSGNGAESPSSAAAAPPEPRRRSCEVRSTRSTLCDLFNIDDDAKNGVNRKLEIESRKVDVEIKEEKEEEVQRNYGGGTVRVCGDGVACFEDDEVTNKTMKEFIDIEIQSRKNSGRDFREIAGSFCKRLIKWRRKQKLKKTCGGVRDTESCVYSNGGTGGRLLKGTQSEVGEYGLLGRRSCDTDPRLSIDAARMSLDGYGYDSRFSFEAPRASWDGYLIGKACPRYSPMIRVNDSKVLVYEEEEEEEGVSLESVGEHFPGGSIQTKDYYSDLNGRRRSFDRSNSRRRLSMANIDELRVISNGKVSPATTELFYGAKVLITDKDLGDRDVNNVQSDCVMRNASKDASDVATRVDQNGLKKLHKWGRLWNKLGLVQRRKEDKLGEEEYGAVDMGNRPISDSWQKLRRVVNGQASGSVSQKLIRSYSVSCRNPCRGDGLANGIGRPESKGNVLNRRPELMIQRNRSIGYSPNNVDTGLLRFYLTPLKSYRRSRS